MALQGASQVVLHVQAVLHVLWLSAHLSQIVFDELLRMLALHFPTFSQNQAETEANQRGVVVRLPLPCWSRPTRPLVVPDCCYGYSGAPINCHSSCGLSARACRTGTINLGAFISHKHKPKCRKSQPTKAAVAARRNFWRFGNNL